MASIVWDADLGRYRYPDGRFVSRAAIRRTWEESLANLTRRTDSLADDLRAGRISLNQWREDLRQVIKQTQMVAAELANGGRAQMTQADYGLVGQRTRVQYQYLEGWVDEIKQGAPLDGRLEPRAALYLKAGRTAFIQAEQQAMQDRGVEIARNVLHAAESCAECIAESAKGWVPIAFLSLPGTRTCLGNCRCVLEYQRAA